MFLKAINPKLGYYIEKEEKLIAGSIYSNEDNDKDII